MHCSILKSLFTFSDGDVENQADWKGYFNVASYAPYFNVDTDVVVDRLISSIYPMDGFFTGKLMLTPTVKFLIIIADDVYLLQA